MRAYPGTKRFDCGLDVLRHRASLHGIKAILQGCSFCSVLEQAKGAIAFTLFLGSRWEKKA